MSLVELINKEPALRTKRKFMAGLPEGQPGSGGTKESPPRKRKLFKQAPPERLDLKGKVSLKWKAWFRKAVAIGAKKKPKSEFRWLQREEVSSRRYSTVELGCKECIHVTLLNAKEQTVLSLRMGGWGGGGNWWGRGSGNPLQKPKLTRTNLTLPRHVNPNRHHGKNVGYDID